MSTIFRDPTEGATARRQDLLRRRRDELVMMPHAIRRVYVARRARTAASLVVCVGGAALLTAAASPRLTHFLASGLPGINPAVLSTMIVAMWIAGLFAYAAARALDEHRFAVAMSRLVMPSKDLDQDIERLSHEHPDKAAREMAHRLEARSAALPVLAASVLLPVTALYLAHAVRVHGWPVIAEFEASVAAHARHLIGSAIVGVVTAIVITRRGARLPRVAPLAALAAIGGGIAALASWHWLAVGALLAGVVAVVVRKLRRERTQLETEDPAAGSEVFTWRGVVHQLRRGTRYLKGRDGRIAMVAAAVLVAGFYPTHARTGTASATVTVAAKLDIHRDATPVTNNAGSTYTVEHMGDGRLRFTIELADDQPLDIKDLAGVATVPSSWTAQLTVELVSSGTLNVTFGDHTHTFDHNDAAPAAFSTSACDVSIQNLGPRVQGAPGKYTLIVKPVLEPAGC